MEASKIYLGGDAVYEREQAALWGDGDLAHLHKHAQRILWGILMADRVELDVDASARLLEAQHGDQFVAHLMAAMVHRWKERQTEADASLARARELVSPEHPLAALVPDDALWRCEPPPCELTELEAGRVYRVVGESRGNHAKPFGNRGAATFLRMASGELVCINPVELSDAVAERVRALGDVTHVLAPARYHNDHLASAKAHFPASKVYGVPAQRGYPQVDHVEFDGYLDDDAPLFPGELDQITMRGIDLGDVFMIDRASGTLLVTDAIFLGPEVMDEPAFEPFRTFYGWLYSWGWGVRRPVGTPSYQPLMWMDLPAYQASLRRVLEHDFERVASCHGPWPCIAADGKGVLERELAWVLGLSRLDGLGLMFDFLKRHPRVFFRFVQLTVSEALSKK